MAYTFNLRNQVETGGLSSRPACSTQGAPGQPGLHNETLSLKKKKNKIKKLHNKI